MTMVVMKAPRLADPFWGSATYTIGVLEYRIWGVLLFGSWRGLELFQGFCPESTPRSLASKRNPGKPAASNYGLPSPRPLGGAKK